VLSVVLWRRLNNATVAAFAMALHYAGWLVMVDVRLLGKLLLLAVMLLPLLLLCSLLLLLMMMKLFWL